MNNEDERIIDVEEYEPYDDLLDVDLLGFALEGYCEDEEEAA